MTVYLILFSLLATLGLASNLHLSRNARLALVLIGYLALVLFVGLRWQTGNDWDPYHDYYHSLTGLQDKSDEFELGYRLVSVGARDLLLPYSAFLLFYSAIYLGLITLSFGQEEFRWTSWLLLLFYSSYLLGWMGTARQVMAIAICLFATKFVLARRPIPFLLCVAAATLFHATAVCYLAAWPLSYLSLKRWHVWAMMGVLIVIVIVGGGEFLVNEAGKIFHISYLDEKIAFYTALSTQELGFQDSDLSFLWYVKRLAFFAFFVAFLGRFTSRAEKLYFNLYLLSLILFVVFIKAIPMLPLRAGLYFSVFELFLLVALIDKFRNRWIRYVYMALLVMMSLGRLYSSIYTYHPDLYIPYKGIFINSDRYRGTY